jgi:hypothetical protein
MKTKNTFVYSTILASAAVLGLSSAAFAQSDPPKNAAQAKQQAPKRVWTNYDLDSVPSPAATKQEQTAQAGASEQPAAANQVADPQQPKAARPSAFTNPKSVEDADKSIAWENRDIQAQQEFLLKIKSEIDEAPADQKDRLTKLLESRTQILADTQSELKNLQAKRKDLAKPPQ